MKVVPVLDLLGGVVVRGVAGQRESYQPVDCPFAASAQPPDVAAGLAGAFDFSTLYVADLDAIGGGPLNPSTYEAIQRNSDNRPLALWIDAGAGDCRRAAALASLPTAPRVVIGLESIASLDDLPALFAAAGESPIFSVDLLGGRPWNESFANRTPLEIASCAIDAGFRRLIVLDLARVGGEDGLSVLDLCRQVKTRFPDVDLISGGGVRGLNDLLALEGSGCDAALVATALHRGALTPADVARFG
ncbi:MAG: HisA/HisF-related TIM barrel protein [Pirellulaceae bacterium]|jgi:phosphoribosylformimino-5-aminoimidazole carboxamide ribotide isomerase|nr:HisA/HisF-related TIM barrel protein [Pirellulaceae bacterium]